MYTTQTHSWESVLLSLASEARQAGAPRPAAPIRDHATLQRAYAHCDAITSAHSRSFHLASGLLPPAKRAATRALYAFCRLTDDIVDRDGDAGALQRWRQHALAPQPPADDLVAIAWADARSRYHIPVRFAEQLVDGVARDLTQKRYQTFAELATYCYGVASTVGLMSMHITGFAGQEAVPYAIKLGVALQLTNILRDVGEDWRAGRVYLPQEELRAFDLDEKNLSRGVVDERWRAFMRFQIERTRQLYAEAWPGIALLDRDARFAIAAAADIYRAILGAIANNGYDTFQRRAHLSTAAKLRRLPALWWQTRSLN